MNYLIPDRINKMPPVGGGIFNFQFLILNYLLLTFHLLHGHDLAHGFFHTIAAAI